VLKLDDTENIKNRSRKFTYCIQRKETVLAMLWKDFSTEEVNKSEERNLL
jgi:hypothetical protein